MEYSTQKVEELIRKHERKMNELRAKAYLSREAGNFDGSIQKEREANENEDRMNYYKELLETIQGE
jgi:hypothetical protein